MFNKNDMYVHSLFNDTVRECLKLNKSCIIIRYYPKTSEYPELKEIYEMFGFGITSIRTEIEEELHNASHGDMIEEGFYLFDIDQDVDYREDGNFVFYYPNILLKYAPFETDIEDETFTLSIEGLL